MSESDDEDSDSANVGDERDFLEKKKRGRPDVATPIRQVRRKESGKKRYKNRKIEISQTGFKHIQKLVQLQERLCRHCSGSLRRKICKPLTLA